MTVAGGKLTTYRRIAAAALEAVGSGLDLGEAGVSPAPLPGPSTPRTPPILDSWPALAAATAARLARTYGSLAAEVLAPGQTDPALLEPLTPASTCSGPRSSTPASASGR